MVAVGRDLEVLAFAGSHIPFILRSITETHGTVLSSKSSEEVKNFMNGIWLVSYLALWIVVIFLLLAMFALVRQVGLLHRRIGPAAARMENEGPEIGELAPELNTLDLQGREVSLGSHRGKQTLLVFISTTCPACEELAPSLRSVWKSERKSLEVLLVTLGGDDMTNRDFVARHKLGNVPFVVSEGLALQYRVFSPPYGVLIDENRVVRAKGVVNHLEHLESLIHAARSGYPSIEKWAQAQRTDNAAMARGALSDNQQAHGGAVLSLDA